MNNSAGDILKFNINFYVKYSSEIFTYIYENEATTTELMNLLMNKKIMNKTSYINLRKSISSFLSRVKKLTNNDLYKEDNIWKINKQNISTPKKLAQFIYFIEQRNDIIKSKDKTKLGNQKNDALYNFLIYGPNGKSKNEIFKSNNIPSDIIKNLIQKENKKIEINKIEITVQDFVNEIIIKKSNGFQIKIII